MTRRMSIALLGLLLSSTACVSTVSPLQQSAPEPGEVRFDLAGPGGAALVVPVTVNGSGPYSFVLDTGATLTCVDEALAKELALEQPAGRIGFGAGVGGSGRMRLVAIESLQVGEAKVTNVTGCALDLTAMEGAGLKVRGLLGLNFLREYRVTLDFTDQSLRLDRPADDNTR